MQKYCHISKLEVNISHFAQIGIAVNGGEICTVNQATRAKLLHTFNVALKNVNFQTDENYKQFIVIEALKNSLLAFCLVKTSKDSLVIIPSNPLLSFDLEPSLLIYLPELCFLSPVGKLYRIFSGPY